jgi:tetrahydromethanopterin S-methyltransferase subunit G
MVVMVPRENWTDERLDDLNKKVDDGFAETKAEMREGFARVDGQIKDLRSEMNTRFNAVDTRFNAVDGRFDKMNESINARFDKMNESINARFDALNRNLIGGLFVLAAAFVGSNAF